MNPIQGVRAPQPRKKPEPKNIFANPFLQPATQSPEKNAVSFGGDDTEEMFVSDPITGVQESFNTVNFDQPDVESPILQQEA